MAGIETERVKLMNTFEKLLVGIVPNGKIENIIENPFGKSWKDDEVHAKIRERLWESFTVFEKTVNNVHAAIQEMKSRLGLQPDGKVRWVDGNAFKRELKRITFTLQKASYDDPLTLTSQSIDLEDQRRRRSQFRVLGLLRETMQSIYHAFKGSLCQRIHNLNLELVVRTAHITPHDEDDKITKDFSFQIVVGIHPNSELGGIYFKDRSEVWEEVIVKEVTLSTPTKTASSSPDPSSGKKVRSKIVRFLSTPTIIISKTGTPMSKESQASSTIVLCQIAAPTTGLIAGTSSKLDGTPLNLCETLRKSQKQRFQDCYGYITDTRSNNCRRYGVHPTTKVVDDDSWSTIPLSQALGHKSTDLPQLTYQDRLYLAVVVSSSVLQLHQTSWLPGKLTSADIFFIKRGDISLFKHAFITQRIPESVRPGTSGSSNWKYLRYNTAIMSLGILLIELILGRSLHRTDASETPESEFLSDYAATQELLNTVYQWGGLGYGDAVRRCLNWHSYRENVNWEDEEFRHDFYSSVVAPLEEVLKHAIT
ncbi:hypothetical protein F4824DRAFT_491742 [Ustulina deusta]|nr:hypothetical protein F4824DRAFT_491742 [Ustulina deusta]